MKNIIGNYILAVSIFGIVSCNNHSADESYIPDTRFLIETCTEDERILDIYNKIMMTDVYQEHCQNTVDTATWRTNVSYFESRKLKINGRTYYHIELYKSNSNLPLESYIQPPFLMCYFRADSITNNVWILNENHTEFIELLSEKGLKKFEEVFE